MENFKKLIKHMDDTLDEAYQYLIDSIHIANSDPKLSSCYLKMSKSHLDMFDQFLEHLKSLNNIDKSILDFEHSRLMSKFYSINYTLSSQ